MQTQFKLSAEEHRAAAQGYIAKHYRTRNLKVSGVEQTEDGSINVTADVVVHTPKPRAKRAETATPKASKKG